jgi:PEP-CTERM motif
MRNLLILITIGVLMIFSTSAFAIPIEVTAGSPYITAPMLLGTDLCFSYMWEINPPVTAGNWPAFNVHIQIGGLPWLGGFYSNSSTGWLEAMVSIPTTFIGTVQPIRFSIDIFNQDINPKVYIKDINSCPTIPEPATIALLCSGLLGLTCTRRKK